MNQSGNDYLRKSSGFDHKIADPRDYLKSGYYSVEYLKGQYADCFIFKNHVSEGK